MKNFFQRCWTVVDFMSIRIGVTVVKQYQADYLYRIIIS